MEEIILAENQINQLPVTTLSKRTISILVANDFAGRINLVKHYTSGNLPNFNELLSVKDRLPDLVKAVGMKNMGKILMAEITRFVNSYTVVRPMSAEQIAGCAQALILSAEEDYLSLQDLIVFFEGAKQGKYGRVLDHIDQHVIFEMLEQYRQERHERYLNLKDEMNGQFKSAGDSTRFSEQNAEKEMDIRKEMVNHYKKSIDNEY